VKKIAIIGLGYVGLPLAVEFSKIKTTVGFDTNEKRIAELLNNYDSTNECSLEVLENAAGLTYTSDIKDIADASIYIVTVPTPIDNAKRPDLTFLKSASATVGSVLCEGNIVIFESTVFPGATEDICVPILEHESNLIFNKDFYCGYSPERINPGDRVNTLRKIKKITSGSTPEIAREIDALYCSIIDAGTHLASSIKIAEAAKVIENSQRDLNIAFVNELSLIFERLEIDTLEVLEAAGSKWNFIPFRPGMVGGHCIGVDPYYLTHKAEHVGYNPQVILAGRRINDSMAKYAAVSIVKKMLQNNINVPQSRVGILGITFKENCPDTRNSKVIDLIYELTSWGVKVEVSDPWAMADAVKSDCGIELTELNMLNNLDAIIIAVGHDEYRELSVDDLKKFFGNDKRNVIGDLKSIFDKKNLVAAGFDVFRF
jgi:UDP-N-acetyl-D-glucosamine/UDP-N-acetyl-D-galactosamine dehydrogenase